MIRASIPIAQMQAVAADTKAFVFYATPTTGQTVSFVNDTRNQIMWLQPVGTLASLTIAFPSEASTKVGQLLRLGTTQNITSLTLTGATMIYNSAPSLATGELAEYVKVAANTWVRL